MTRRVEARPPRLWRALLALTMAPGERRFALADLEEELEARAERESRAAALRWYRGQVLRSILPALVARVGRVFRRALGEIGGPDTRGKRRFEMIGWIPDLKVAWRNQRRAPIAGVVTVLSLGLGLGAVTVAVALVRQIVFPAPVGLSEPDRLVTLYTTDDEGGAYGLSSWADYSTARDSLDALEDAAAFSVRSLALGRGEDVVSLLAEEVSGNYFTVTGIRPFLGRGIEPAESKVGGASRVAVVSHRLWQERLGGRPDVVGDTIVLNGRRFEVIGVAPRGIVSRRVPLETDVWIPVGVPDGTRRASAERFESRASRTFLVLGRLAEGAGIDELQAQASTLAAALSVEHPEAWSDPDGRVRTFTVVAERESRLNPRARGLLLAIGLFFVGASGLVLLIACSNAAGLFLARAVARRREIAVRRSLGAGRWRLLRLWIVDGLVPGLWAGLVAWGVVRAAARAIGSLAPPINLPIRLDLHLGPSVLVFLLLLSIAVSLLFAVAPAAMGARVSVQAALSGNEQGGRRRARFGLRNLLVAGQCAAAVVLVVGAALFLRALGRAAQVDLGLDAEGVALVSKTLDEGIEPEAGLARYRDIVSRLEARPEVEQATVARSVELTLLQLDAAVDVLPEGADLGPTEPRPEAFRNAILPGYLEMLGIQLLRGRPIGAADVAGAPPVAVVNQTLARRLWPGLDLDRVLGRSFVLRAHSPGAGAPGPPRLVEVVGVARDGKYLDFDDGATPYLWTSLAQDYSPRVAVVVKGRGDAASLLPALREEVPLEEGELRHLAPSALVDQLSIQFVHLRIASRVLGWGGAFGLLLATLGIYGVVALSVTQRRREIALRIAVGARRSQVLGAVIGDSLVLAGLGLVVGLLVALPLAGLLRSVLVGVRPLDPLALGAGSALLLVTALLASLGPARRAARADPVVALRDE